MPRADGPLFRAPGYRRLLAFIALMFTLEGILQPVIPLLILAGGGDAALVGLVAACFSIPALPLRPVAGRLLDAGGAWVAYRAAAVLVTASQLVFLVPT